MSKKRNNVILFLPNSAAKCKKFFKKDFSIKIIKKTQQKNDDQIEAIDSQILLFL